MRAIEREYVYLIDRANRKGNTALALLLTEQAVLIGVVLPDRLLIKV